MKTKIALFCFIFLSLTQVKAQFCWTFPTTTTVLGNNVIPFPNTNTLLGYYQNQVGGFVPNTLTNSENTFVGANAGAYNNGAPNGGFDFNFQTGNGNTFMGSNTAQGLVAGSNNVIIGLRTSVVGGYPGTPRIQQSGSDVSDNNTVVGAIAATCHNCEGTSIFGRNSVTTANGGVCVGADVQNHGINAIAIGRFSDIQGILNGEQADNAIAIGSSSIIGPHAFNTIAIGALSNAGAFAEQSICIGASSSLASTATYAIAMGRSAVSNAGNSIAIGRSASIATAASNSIAIGNAATTNEINSITIGSNTKNIGKRANVVGESSSIGATGTAVYDTATVVGWKSSILSVVGTGNNNLNIFGNNSSLNLAYARRNITLLGNNINNTTGNSAPDPNTIILGTDNATNSVPKIGIGTYKPNAKVTIISSGANSGTSGVQNALTIYNSSAANYPATPLVYLKNDNRLGIGTSTFPNGSHMRIADISPSGNNLIQVDDLPSITTFDDNSYDLVSINNTTNQLYRYTGVFGGGTGNVTNNCTSPISGNYVSGNTVDKFQIPYLNGNNLTCSLFEQQKVSEDCSGTIGGDAVAGVNWNSVANPNEAIPGYYLDILGNCNPLAFSVNGNTLIAGNNYVLSDKDVKKDIQKIENVSDLIKKLNPVTYNFNSDNKYHLKVGNGGGAGFIAQELEKVLPNTVITTDLGFKAVNYEAIIPYLVSALQENKSDLESKEAKIQELSAAFSEQQNELTDLKNQVAELAAMLGTKSKSELNSNPAEQYTTPTLFQNKPNPFNSETEINYYLPADCSTAALKIISMEGKEVKTIDLHETGNAKIILNAKSLQPGVYLYKLICSGKMIDQKKMTITE